MKAKRRGNKDNQSFWKRTVIIQLIILLMFFILFKNSIPCDAEQLQQTTIVVEEKTYLSGKGWSSFSVYAQSKEFGFVSIGLAGRYGNSELYDMISKGDILTVTYYEEERLLGGKVFCVAAAHTNNEELRTLDEYYKAHTGVDFLLCLIFGILEIFFLGFCTLDILVNNRIKGFLRLVKKRWRSLSGKNE